MKVPRKTIQTMPNKPYIRQLGKLYCNGVIWKKCSNGHKAVKRKQDNNLHIRNVVLIKSYERNTDTQKIGIFEQVIKGKDGIVRAVKLKAEILCMERENDNEERQPKHNAAAIK